MQVLIGRVTADAVVNTTKSDKQVVNFSIALNRTYKDKEGNKKEQTTFVNCSYWLNTTIAAYLTKGTLVEVAGFLSANAYTDHEGNPKASINLHANNINLHGKPNGKEPVPAPKKNGKKKTSKAEPVEQQEAEITEPIDDLPF